MRSALLALALLAGLADAAPSCPHNLTFYAPWSGGDAWLVNYTGGPFSNDRPPHVQVGSSQVKNVRRTLHRRQLRAVARPTGAPSRPHTHTPSPSPLLQHTKGEFWCLANCRAATSSAIEYDLPGCFNSALPNDATCHITVFYKSGAAKANVAEYCA